MFALIMSIRALDLQINNDMIRDAYYCIYI